MLFQIVRLSDDGESTRSWARRRLARGHPSGDGETTLASRRRHTSPGTEEVKSVSESHDTVVTHNNDIMLNRLVSDLA